MEKYAFITGADRGLGYELTKQFLAGGYSVFAGRYLPEWILHNSIKEGGGQVMVFDPGWMRTYIGGKPNDEATFSPETSAANIKGIIDRHEEFKGSEPTFIDHLGNKWPW